MLELLLLLLIFLGVFILGLHDESLRLLFGYLFPRHQKELGFVNGDF